ncbi:MAG: hypothetical protein UH734_05875 [Ruminococcus sp.]|nr:hypothetical protein [Ruminococcus sp.]
MKNNKVAKVLNIIFSFLFTVVFIRLLYMILAIGYQNNTERNTYNCTFEEYIQIIVTGIVLTFIFAAVYYALQTCRMHKIRRKITDSKRQTRIIIFAAVGVMLALQLTAAYFLATEPVTDLKIINRYAQSFAHTGNFDMIQKDAANNFIYMIRYPNNLALMFLLSFVYRVDFLITGYVSNYIAVILNTLAINSSVLMTALLAQKLFGNKKALMTLMLCMLFVPFYTYTPYYYTDSMSMPFFVGGMYLFFSAVRSDTKYKKYVLMLICGVVLLLGFKMKGSVAILAAVGVVYMLLKLNFKRFACLTLALAIGFGGAYAVYTAAYRASNIITKEQEYKYEFPPTHWIMMGLKGYGCYTIVDAEYTGRRDGKDAKVEANMEIINSRIEQRNNRTNGVDDMLTHLDQKSVWTWEDGAYFISHHIDQPRNGRNFLHELVLNDGENHMVLYAYCCGFQLFLILMMALSAFRCIIKPSVNEYVLMRGVVMAIFVFLLIWETRSRYLYNFTPAFLMLAVDGLDTVRSGIDFVRKSIKKKNKAKRTEG